MKIRSGDIYGKPFEGHRVTEIYAFVVVYSDGSEGLASAYMIGEDGTISRTTFTTSSTEVLTIMKETTSKLQAPKGGHFEWRTYTLKEGSNLD